MAYDPNKPAFGSSLVSAEIRENFRALKEDRIVDADSVDGYHASSTPTASTIVVSGTNGTINNNWLNISETPGSGKIPVGTSTLKGISSKWIKRKVEIASKCGVNGFLVLLDGKLYSTAGNPSSSYIHGKGIGIDSARGLWQLTPVPIPSTSKVIRAGTYGMSAYCLLENGDLYTWGYNGYGQLGLGHTTDVGFPTLAAQNVLDVYSHPTQSEYDCNYARLFILKSDGLYACGANTQGQLGVGDTTNRTTFTKCTVFTSSSQISKVFPLGSHLGVTVVLTTDGKIYVCGYNEYGQLGLNDTLNRTSFVDATTPWAGVSSGVLDLDCGYCGAFYIGSSVTVGSLLMLITTSSGKVIKSCGSNGFGQLGDGTTTNRQSPTTVLNSSGATDFSFNFTTGHFLTSSGNLYGWGYNYYGQIGTGDTNNRSTPVSVATSVQKILFKNFAMHTYGVRGTTFILKSNGVYATGYNAQGEAGVGVTSGNISSFTLIPFHQFIEEGVSDMAMWTDIGGVFVYVALTSDYNLYAWGYNANYEIAWGTSNCYVPILVRLPIS